MEAAWFVLTKQCDTVLTYFKFYDLKRLSSNRHTSCSPQVSSQRFCFINHDSHELKVCFLCIKRQNDIYRSLYLYMEREKCVFIINNYKNLCIVFLH